MFIDKNPKILQKMKENHFLCPTCRGQLIPNNKIVLSAQKENGERGLILIDPTLGEYSAISHKNFNLSDGEHLKVFCPICHADLSEKSNPEDLAKVVMINGEKEETYVIFSIIVGKKCTYKVYGNRIEIFGSDADMHINFWGEEVNY